MKTTLLSLAWLLISIAPIASVQASVASSCEMSTEGIMHSYTVLKGHPENLQALQCLLKIHQQGQGLLKSLAADAIRPFFGGKALAGRSLDSQTRAAAQKLQELAMQEPDLIHQSFLSEYTKGSWGFYDLFCTPPKMEFCALFLPDESQVHRESPLMGSSSMLLLRQAYLTLNGSDQKLVGERLRNLYASIPQQDLLKRKVIEQIYQELFLLKAPLALRANFQRLV